MNAELESLAQAVDLKGPANARLRLAFGFRCAQRVRHLLEEPEAVHCLDALGRHLEGGLSDEGLASFAERAHALASQHPGSKSIDGCGHAAVSASYAVAHALAGRALQAAEYAAYAAVYAEGGYGAVADRQSFGPEYVWQVQCLSNLV